MRILYVTSGFPYPLTSGYLRHYHLIGSLRDEGEMVTGRRADEGRCLR